MPTLPSSYTHFSRHDKAYLAILFGIGLIGIVATIGWLAGYPTGYVGGLAILITVGMVAREWDAVPAALIGAVLIMGFIQGLLQL